MLAVLQAGANGYVLKTASPAEIVQALRDVHEGKSALDPSIAQKLVAHITHRTQSEAERPLAETESLTDRELEVLGLASKGYTNKAIGFRFGISDRTVQGHLAKNYTRLDANSHTEAVMRAVSLGLITAGNQ